jgi:hypothetical protein
MYRRQGSLFNIQTASPSLETNHVPAAKLCFHSGYCHRFERGDIHKKVSPVMAHCPEVVFEPLCASMHGRLGRTATQ